MLRAEGLALNFMVLNCCFKSCRGRDKVPVIQNRRSAMLAALSMCALSPVAFAANSYLAVDLSAPAYTASAAMGVSNTEQVGFGLSGAQYHALLWNGSASTVVDLHPGSGYSYSQAAATNGSIEVGYALPTTAGAQNQASMWTGSASSFVNLNPANFSTSQATAVAGTQEVGFGSGTATSSNYHALLWNNSATSFTDLNPSGFTSSHATGTNGVKQVGYGTKTAGNAIHALLWSGTAASFVDLNPSSFTTSVATAKPITPAAKPAAT